MCIRDSGSVNITTSWPEERVLRQMREITRTRQDALTLHTCLLYTSDAADERSSVDLGGRRIIKKNKSIKIHGDYEE